jgi:hypothetical protein
MGTTPIMDRRVAQKNLAPFAVDVAVTDPDPDITWRNFMAGDPIQFLLGHGDFGDQAGRNRLILEARLPDGAFRLFLAIPGRSYKRWIAEDGIKGFKPVGAAEAEKLKPPFKECVVLALEGKEGVLEVPPLGREYLAMSLGVQYRVKMLKPGQEGEIVMRQETYVPHIDRKRKTYEIKREVVGGFTFTLDVQDSRMIPDWMKAKK